MGQIEPARLAAGARRRKAPRIAAIVPCHNEEVTVAKVVTDLKAAVPGITVYVYDNRSTDATAQRARAAGAVVRREERPGKGNVIRRAFSDIEADVYVTIDGDDTYEAADLPAMIEKLLSGPCDHVLGVRQDDPDNSAYRPGHAAGNAAFNRLTGKLFGDTVSDMLSGYRVYSRRFVKSFPALSRRFEIETELTVHQMALRLPGAEHPVGFRDRPAGSESKLSTVKDGVRILLTLARLVRVERPTAFYGVITALFALGCVLFGVPVIAEFVRTGLVPRLPTAVLAASCALLAALCAVAGLILDGQRLARREVARLRYLALATPVPTRASRVDDTRRSAGTGAEGARGPAAQRAPRPRRTQHPGSGAWPVVPRPVTVAHAPSASDRPEPVDTPVPASAAAGRHGD